MRIAFASDLHLEYPSADRSRALAFPDDADVIVLAGDIHVGKGAAEIALELASLYPKAHVVWVAGNHELYGHNIDLQIKQYRAECAQHERVNFLENDAVQIGEIRFVGCTLWTDFSLLGETRHAMELAEKAISDFSMIQTKKGRWFTPKDARERFQQSCRYLKSELSTHDPANLVVVTHFPPGLSTHNQNFNIGSITAYFQANVDHLIDRYQPAVWVYGHNHYSNHIRRGATQLVSNQLGYPSEAGSIPGYDATNAIDLNLDGKDGE